VSAGGGNMRRGSPLRQRFGRTPTNGGGSARPFVPNFLQFHGVGASARDDDQVDTVGEESRREAEALPAEALDPIASHCSADFSAYDQAQARPGGGGLRGDEKHEVACHDALCVGLDAPEVRLATQPPGAIEGRAQGYFL
jgi:hypothetical protein